jgi:hypothetical protein
MPPAVGLLQVHKRYRMAYHFKAPSVMSGVSSPVWDCVFRTAVAG